MEVGPECMAVRINPCVRNSVGYKNIFVRGGVPSRILCFLRKRKARKSKAAMPQGRTGRENQVQKKTKEKKASVTAFGAAAYYGISGITAYYEIAGAFPVSERNGIYE